MTFRESSALLTLLFLAVANGMSFYAGLQHGKARSHEDSQTRFKRSPTPGTNVRSFHVTSKVASRYSRVLITSVIENWNDDAAEVSVDLKLPKTAFISNFSLEIEGQIYVGKVKEKEAAAALYQTAQSQGHSAGLVTTKIRGSQTFGVSVNVAAGQSVTFRLNYEELLKRKLGVYNHVIYVDPGQDVEDFLIQVHISEQVGITKVTAESPSTHARPHHSPFDVGQSGDAKIRKSETQAFITYEPTIKQQQAAKSRPFVVTYDVTRKKLGGDILIKDGYFIHFFAPGNLPVISKDIVFVIDVSGSMDGQKIRHTQQAFKTIIGDLKVNDRFNIITFSGAARQWQRGELVDVNDHNIARAKSFVAGIEARGSTNFYEAMSQGISLLAAASSPQANTLERAGMIIILTDGLPTAGITDNHIIRRDMKKKVGGRYSIFCLGFGTDVDHNFLDALSRENQGVSRRIYDDSDAALQLKGFYDEVASPMLAHVIINYTGVAVDDLSNTNFDKYFDGSEIVVVGRITDEVTLRSPYISPSLLRSTAIGNSLDGEVTLVAKGEGVEESFVDKGFDMEKIWAYLTIKELLKNKSLSNDERWDQTEINDRVIKMSLKYNFVTDLTSMIATKPNQRDTIGREIDTDDVQPLPRTNSHPILPSIPFPQARSHRLSLHRSSMTYNVGMLPRYQLSYFCSGINKIASKSAIVKSAIMSFPSLCNILTHQSRIIKTTTTTTTTTTTAPPTTTEVPAPEPPQNPLLLDTICTEVAYVNGSFNFTSPNHPGLYPSGTVCVWDIKKPALENEANPHHLTLTISKMDIEGPAPKCPYDRLWIYPNFDNDADEPEILTYCGAMEQEIIVTARDRLVAVFQSDNVVAGRGFAASVNITETAL